MNKRKESNLSYVSRMFAFMRPYMLTFIPGLSLYCSQGFIISLMNSVFLSRVTADALSANARGIIYAAVAFLGLLIIYFLILAPGVVMYVSGIEKAKKDLKAKLFRRFVKTSLERSVASHSGEGIAAINTDSDTASDILGNAISPLISCIISIVFSAFVVFLIDYRLGLASVGIGLLAFLIQYKFSKPLGKIGEETLSANAASVKEMSNIFSGALAIRAFNAQQRALVSFDKENGELKVLSFKQASISMWQTFFTTIQGWLTLTGVFALGGYLVATGRLSFPSLMMVPAMCESIASGMAGIGSAWAGLQAPIAASKRVFSILDGGGDGDLPEPEPRPAADADNGSYVLRLNGLSFGYLAVEENALNDITFEIGENEMVAFVGESGSGKSTLLRTIIGMYERDGLDMSLGTLRFDKDDILTWRGRFAYVDQSCKLFDMSIAENIALGANKPLGDSLRDEIKAAASAANASAFIEALAEGYDTPCGEKGTSLSGGQKQRVAIARALIRKAPILVFDEATSALDAESERSIMETIEGLRGNHTILITTHNLSNILNADKIIVMDGGRVAETGSHDELLEKDGLYKRLYTQGRKE